MDSRAKEAVLSAIDSITSYLLDNTEDADGFEVIPDLDQARSTLMEILETQPFPEIETMVVLSTGCLPQCEGEYLNVAIANGLVNGMQRKEGWLVHTKQTPESMEIAPVLDGILRLVEAAGAEWALFDEAGPCPPGFTLYEW